MLDKLRAFDIGTWIRGIVSAGISGFFSALTSALVLPALDPTDFNIYHLRFYIAMVAFGGTASVVSISKFLSNQPLPDMKQVIKTVETVTAPHKAPVVTTTVQETSIEPNPPKDCDKT